MKYLLIFLLIFCGLLQAQRIPLNKLERQRKKLIDLQVQLSLKESLLQKQLTPLQKKIDSLQKNSGDRHQINDYQKKALTLSRRLITLQNQQDSLGKNIKGLNALLYREYTNRLDSLRKLPKAPTAQEEKQRLLKLNRLSLKRLEVSPELQNLPFDLRKLNKLKVKQPKDSLEKTIVIDYLQRALQVVNTQYNYLQEKREELLQMKRLRQKALSFVNEINNGSIGAPLVVNNKSSGKIVTDAAATRNLSGTTSVLPFPVTSPDLAQIDRLIRQSMQAHTPVSVDSVLNAIQQAQKLLRDYRKIIHAKLKQ